MGAFSLNRTHTIFITCLSTVLLSHTPLSLASVDVYVPVVEVIQPDTSTPFPADPEDYDWLLVKKGELFAGEIIAMYDEYVEFDSDEVGLHKIKMSDIKELRTKDIMRLRFYDGRIIEGHIVINEDHIYLLETPYLIYARDNVLSISPSQKSGESLWMADLAGGLNFKSGNTESFDYYIRAKVRYLSTTGRLTLSYEGVYEEVTNSDTDKTVTTEERHRTVAQYDYRYSPKVRLTLPSIEVVVDEFRNLDYQATIGIAAKYEVIDVSGLEFFIYAGPSIQYTQFVNVLPGEDRHVSSPALAIGFEFEMDLTSDVEYFSSYDGRLVNNDSGSYIQRLDIGLDIELTNNFDLEVMTMINNTIDPVPDNEGNTPDKTDILFAIGIEYEF